MYVTGHDSKPSSSENLRLRPPSRTKESLNVPVAEASCFVSVSDVSPEQHVSAVSSSTVDRQVHSSHAAHRAVVESTPNGAVLRPTLTLSRKGHGHRHRRAMRRASSGVSCAVPLSLVEVDPREPQVVLSESALLSTHCQSRSRHPDPAEAVAMRTLNASHATVTSPAHSDLSSLSSYKETSPESEAAAPSSLHLLKLNASCPFKINLTEARRRSDNRLSSLSHSRDSLEMYKNRTQRKLSVDGMVLSESAIVHAVAEPACLAPNSADVVSADSADHVIQTQITGASLESSDNECLATVSDEIRPEDGASNISADRVSLSSVVAEVSATTSCDDVTDQACGGCSPSECKSESSNTLTPATDVSVNTVRKRTGKNGKSKSASKKLTSLFCGASTSAGSEVGDDVPDLAVEVDRANSTALDWLFSTDSEDSPSSGKQPCLLNYTEWVVKNQIIFESLLLVYMMTLKGHTCIKVSVLVHYLE